MTDREVTILLADLAPVARAQEDRAVRFGLWLLLARHGLLCRPLTRREAASPVSFAAMLRLMCAAETSVVLASRNGTILDHFQIRQPVLAVPVMAAGEIALELYAAEGLKHRRSKRRRRGASPKEGA